jgi:hypothetical protein
MKLLCSLQILPRLCIEVLFAHDTQRGRTPNKNTSGKMTTISAVKGFGCNHQPSLANTSIKATSVPSLLVVFFIGFSWQVRGVRCLCIPTTAQNNQPSLRIIVPGPEWVFH